MSTPTRMSCKVSAVRLVLWSCASLGCGLLLWLCIIAFGLATIEKTLPKTLQDNSNWIDELTNTSAIFSSCNYGNDDLQRIMSSAATILSFMERHIDDLVIDAAIGTRIMESQMRLFQLGHPNLPPTFRGALQFMQNRCKRLSETIIDKLMSKEMPTSARDQLLENLYWVNDSSLWDSPGIGNWRSEHEPKLILFDNVTIATITSKGNYFDEKLSDTCIADIFRGCTVTDECAGSFMGKVGACYLLTHQIFYLLFANKKNCFDDQHFKQKMGDKSPAELMHRMCNKVWQEANAIQDSDFPFLFRDLLTEQVTICSLLGYTQFLKVSWLKAILSWQGENGCYAVDVDVASEALPERNSTQNGERVKRSDNLLQMGSEKCSVHFTTVALCAMAMHLRYFGDTCMRNV